MHALARTAPEPANEDMPTEAAAERAVRDIAERLAKLGVEITDISGRISDVTRQLDGQTHGLHRVVTAVDQVSRANRAIEQAAEGAQTTASAVRHGLERVTGAVRQGLNSAQSDIEALSQGAQSISEALSQAVTDAHKVRATPSRPLPAKSSCSRSMPAWRRLAAAPPDAASRSSPLR